MRPVTDQLLRLALTELVDRHGGEVVLDADDLRGRGRALQLCVSSSHRLIMRVVTDERAQELIRDGARDDGAD